MLNIFLILSLIMGGSIGIAAAQTQPPEQDESEFFGQRIVPAPPMPKEGFAKLLKPVVCGSSAYVLKQMKEQNNETEVELVGILNTAEGTSLALTIHRNRETGTYTVVESNPTGQSCILHVGSIFGRRVNLTTPKEDGPKL